VAALDKLVAMISSSFTRAIVCSLLLVVGNFNIRPARSQQLEKINFGFSAAGSVATAPLWMAQDSVPSRNTGSTSS